MGPEGLVAVAVVTVEGEESERAGPTGGRSWGGASGFGERETEGRSERRKVKVVVLHHVTHHHTCFIIITTQKPTEASWSKSTEPIRKASED